MDRRKTIGNVIRVCRTKSVLRSINYRYNYQPATHLFRCGTQLSTTTVTTVNTTGRIYMVIATTNLKGPESTTEIYLETSVVKRQEDMMLIHRKRRQRTELLRTSIRMDIPAVTSNVSTGMDYSRRNINMNTSNSLRYKPCRQRSYSSNRMLECNSRTSSLSQSTNSRGFDRRYFHPHMATKPPFFWSIQTLHTYIQILYLKLLSLFLSIRKSGLAIFVLFLLVPSIDSFTIPSHSVQKKQCRTFSKTPKSTYASQYHSSSLFRTTGIAHALTTLSSDGLAPFSEYTDTPTTNNATQSVTDEYYNNNNNPLSAKVNDPNKVNQSFVLSQTPDIITQQPYDHVQNVDGSYTVRYVSDDGLQIYQEDTTSPTAVTTTTSSVTTVADIAPGPLEQQNRVTLPPAFLSSSSQQSPNRITETSAFTSIIPRTGFNVVLTHCTADFDSLASAVGLAKLWSSNAITSDDPDFGISHNGQNKSFDSASHVPTYVVLPRGAHPGVQRFLGLHKHLFPIRSLKSILSSDHISSLNRLALVDAQRRDRLGPAEPLLQHANRITIVDHHVDQDSDILANDYVMDQVGSVSTIIVERLQQATIASPGKIQLTEAEATLLALGIHADTGNLCFDSTTVRDAYALAWCMSQGASQTAIAEHGQSSLSAEQQGVLTQALVNANSTVVHGVTIATVLLQADGFINGMAAVTQDALELSSSDIFLLGLVYQAKSGSGSRKSKKGTLLTTQLLSKDSSVPTPSTTTTYDEAAMVLYAEAWQGGEEALRRRRLRIAFDRTDIDGSGYLDETEIATSLASSGVMALPDNATSDLIKEIDTDGNGKIDFEEFVTFATEAEKRQRERNSRLGRKGTTMIIIGRVKAGVNMKSVKLNKLLEQFGGGGHAKAASATVRLNDESEAEGILQALVDELISTNLQEQPTVGDFVSFHCATVSICLPQSFYTDFYLVNRYICFKR